jgi:hypothetical protein
VKTDLGGDGAPMEIEDGAKTSVVGDSFRLDARSICDAFWRGEK